MEWERAKRRRPNQKPRKVYKQRLAKCVLKQDSSGDLSSSEESEETLFRSEEKDADYYKTIFVCMMLRKKKVLVLQCILGN